MTDRPADPALRARRQSAVEAARPSLLSAGVNVARSAASAAGSLWRTRVARQGRLTDVAYEARLATCRSCPSGHATFDARGKLKTCGRMLSGMASSDKKATGCGCHLRGKARDAQQSCPMGHWPTVRQTDLQPDRVVTPPPATPSPATPAIVSSSASTAANDAGRLILPGHPLWSFSRRGFLRRATAAGLAGSAATLLGPRVVKGRDKPDCFVKIKPCSGGGGPAEWVGCEVVNGKPVNGTIVKAAGFCYELENARVVPEEEAQGEKLHRATTTASCADCAGVYTLTPCDGGASIVTDTDLSSAVGTATGGGNKIVEVDSSGECYTVGEGGDGTAIDIGAFSLHGTCCLCSCTESSLPASVTVSWSGSSVFNGTYSCTRQSTDLLDNPVPSNEILFANTSQKAPFASGTKTVTAHFAFDSCQWYFNATEEGVANVDGTGRKALSTSVSACGDGVSGTINADNGDTLSVSIST